MYKDERKSGVTAEGLEQHFVLCPLGAKDVYVVQVLRQLFARLPDSLVLIFVRNCKESQILAVMLRGLGFKVCAGRRRLKPRCHSFRRRRFTRC